MALKCKNFINENLNMMMQKCLFFSVLLLMFSCNANKPATSPEGGTVSIPNTTKCKIKGIVKDFSGLDGCTFLIELENGERWLPVAVNDESFQLRDDQAILFGYQEATDMVSICMAESKMIEITCISEITKPEDRPVVPTCYDIENVADAPWMAEVVKTLQPFRIMKYTYLDGWAYLMLSKKGRKFYDCQGTDLCPPEKGDADNCLNQHLKLLSDGKTIYQAEPSND